MSNGSNWVQSTVHFNKTEFHIELNPTINLNWTIDLAVLVQKLDFFVYFTHHWKHESHLFQKIALFPNFGKTVLTPYFSFFWKKCFPAWATLSSVIWGGWFCVNISIIHGSESKDRFRCHVTPLRNGQFSYEPKFKWIFLLDFAQKIIKWEKRRVTIHPEHATHFGGTHNPCEEKVAD